MTWFVWFAIIIIVYRIKPVWFATGTKLMSSGSSEAWNTYVLRYDGQRCVVDTQLFLHRVVREN